jgi:hypothetical protein
VRGCQGFILGRRGHLWAEAGPSRFQELDESGATFLRTEECGEESERAMGWRKDDPAVVNCGGQFMWVSFIHCLREPNSVEVIRIDCPVALFGDLAGLDKRDTYCFAKA